MRTPAGTEGEVTRADLKKMMFVFFVSAIAFALGTLLMGVLLFRSYEENTDLRRQIRAQGGDYELASGRNTMTHPCTREERHAAIDDCRRQIKELQARISALRTRSCSAHDEFHLGCTACDLTDEQYVRTVLMCEK